MIRFNSGSGIDHYRQIAHVDKVNGEVTFVIETPEVANYSDVEFGYYFSDWSERDGSMGVSDICKASRKQTTLPIDIESNLESVSLLDWSNKIGALPAIDSTGIIVTREILDLSSFIGFEWNVTFLKQPGNVNNLVCFSLSGNNTCDVNVVQESSMISGTFQVSTTWPHEYENSNPLDYESDNLRWNILSSELETKLESILNDTNKVLGNLHVYREPYLPSIQNRWSGGYTWTITFVSRGGNIPMMRHNSSNLLGNNVVLAVSDEDSGVHDTYQGGRNENKFLLDDHGIARDGNPFAGQFSLSWAGNSFHSQVSTGRFTKKG